MSDRTPHARVTKMLERLRDDAVMSKFASQRDCEVYRSAVGDMLNMLNATPILEIDGDLAEYKARAERAEIAQVEHARRGCAAKSETNRPVVTDKMVDAAELACEQPPYIRDVGRLDLRRIIRAALEAM